MFIRTLILTWALTVAPEPQPPIADAPPDPEIIDVTSGEVTRTDGRVRWASVRYEIITGHEAETFAEADDTGRASLWVYVEGEALVHVTADSDGVTSTWTATNIDLPREAIIQLMGAAVADDLFAGLMPEPKAFPSSEFGKGVLKAAKYVWVATATTLQVACCVGGAGVGCLLCAVGGGLAELAGSEALEDYCA